MRNSKSTVYDNTINLLVEDVMNKTRERQVWIILTFL